MRLLYFIFSSSVLIGLVLLIRKIFRKQIAPGVLYVLWLIPLIRLLFPFGFWELPVFGTATEIFGAPYTVLSELAERLAEGEIGYSDEQNRTASRTAEGLKAEPTEVLSGKGQEPALQETDGREYSEHDSKALYRTSEVLQSGKEREKSVSAPIAAFLFIWLCGSLFLCGYSAVSNLRLRRGIRHMEKEQEDCPLPVCISDAVISPCLFGLFRPCILVNRAVREEPKLYQYVLKHELTHYRRKDHIWTFLRIIICAAYWWHPFVWLGASCSGEDAELACDAEVIRGLSPEGRKAYGYSLLQLLQHAQNGGSRMCVATSMSGSRKSLRKRVEEIADGTITKKRVLFPVCVLLTVIMLCGCSMPSARNWIKAENQGELLSAAAGQKAEYEYVFQDDIRSRLFYYEVYESGELKERRILSFGNIEERKGTFGLTLQQLSGEDLQGEGYYAILDPGGMIKLPLPQISFPLHSGFLLGEGKKREIQSGDDLILMADYLSEGEALSSYTCESLEELAEEERGEALKENDAAILIHMAVSDRTEAELAEIYERTEYTEMQAGQDTAAEAEKFVNAWADAFAGRNGEAIWKMTSAEARMQMENELLIQDEDSYFGWSSPWPMSPDNNYRILGVDGQKAEILYYAWASDPHMWVWRETLELTRQGETYQVAGEELKMLNRISSGEEFYMAYPKGEITGTPMDYQANGFGEALNQHAVEHRGEAGAYDKLFDAGQAACFLLNIADSDGVTLTDESEGAAISVENRGDTAAVQITFPLDESTVEVVMIQPYGQDGIWIPQTEGFIRKAI